ncbi:uncharacterized protein BKCO1_3000220 [Diplodia corticola]|uniref:DUF221-domain-containing protein n=1 Tax=Diplodia corticola TaxID=236234 RepID=A0A1J9SGG2_9PEZI|nr:uncharacterized protein BKCO1_3000220 [Diplodia corticola]OJD38884.1 hypothetical protein BKCO1_3000220 [Diplodia corticola]
MDGAYLSARSDPVNQSDDPRIGSSRDNSSSATVTGISSGSNSASVSALFTTLIPVAIYVGVCLLIFLLLRRKCPRVYAPRTFLSSLHPYERSPPLPGTWFTWFKAFWCLPDTYVLNHSSVDGFLFLRFLRVVRNLCLAGCCLTWPILLPLHICGGGGGEQLDRLTFGNVSDDHRRWFFAHAVVAWLFFGIVLYTVCRECIYAINLRQAYLLSPFYADRLSSRTVLFTCVPEQLLDEAKLRKVFGDSVKNVWIPKTSWELERLVRERDQTASRLQDAELELVRKANIAWKRIAKNGHPDIRQPDVDLENGPVEHQRTHTATTTTTSTESADEKLDSAGALEPVKFGLEGPPFDIPGSIAAQWIPQEDRPRHRPLANYLRRVDTIRWTRKRLKKLGKEINKVRKRVNRGDVGHPMPAAFIEFTSQNEAQIAYQSLAHHRPSHMSQRYIGVRPYEIVWFSLRMRWWERIVRRTGIMTATALMTVFWSIPCAFVGMTSNISFLADSVPFLSWIELLPDTILGFLTGLLPAFALSMLMAIVPGILRVFARAAGVPSLTHIEMFTQRAYFGFQVLQVFLVTTFTSSASASISQIINDPMSARSLLATCLPKASNFYLSYMIIQCLGKGASDIVHLSAIFKYYVAQRFGRNPKIMYRRWHRMRNVHWGGIMPVFINLGVIAISYSVIAPLILGFTALGCSIMHLVFKYNLLYVYSSEIDTRGLSYILALKQLLTGLYLAEVCLLGLFALRLSFGPVVMMFISITTTAVIHISLNEAVGPLLDNLPRSLSGGKSANQPPGDDNAADSDSLLHPGFGDLPFEYPTFEPPDLDPDPPAEETIHVENGTRSLDTVSRAPSSNAPKKPSKDDYDDSDSDSSSDSDTPSIRRRRRNHHNDANPRALEGAEGLAATTFDLLKLLARVHFNPDKVPDTNPDQSNSSPQDQQRQQQQQKQPASQASKTARDALATISDASSLLATLISPPPPPPPPSHGGPPLGLADALKHRALAFLHPEVYDDFARLQALLLAPEADAVPDVSGVAELDVHGAGGGGDEGEGEGEMGGEEGQGERERQGEAGKKQQRQNLLLLQHFLRDAYASPAMISGAPRVWVPDDTLVAAGAGCSAQETAHCGKVTGVVGQPGAATLTTTAVRGRERGGRSTGAGCRVSVDLDAEWEELIGETGDKGGGGGKVWMRDGELDWGRWRWW